MKYLAPIAKEIGDKLEKSQNEGKQEIADLQEGYDVLKQKQKAMVQKARKFFSKKLDVDFDQITHEEALKLDMRINEELMILGEKYPAAAFALYQANIQTQVAIEQIDDLKKANHSFPLKKYNYSKKNQTIN